MSYKIIDIKKTRPKKGESYFFDANIWMIILQGRDKIKPYEKYYIDFFEKIIEISDSTKYENEKPYIITNTVVISETFNAFMRSEFDIYRNNISQNTSSKRNKNLTFKKDFRPTKEHEEAKRLFQNDIEAYWPYVRWIKEDHANIDLLNLVTNIPVKSDFNDYLYYEICIENEYNMVTNDRDFLLPNITILTNNKRLLKKAK